MKKAVYIAIGIDLDRKKDVLGMWVGENENAKFWATVLNSLKNRGVEGIFIACTDNRYIHWYNCGRIKLSLRGLSTLEYRHSLGFVA